MSGPKNAADWLGRSIALRILAQSKGAAKMKSELDELETLRNYMQCVDCGESSLHGYQFCEHCGDQYCNNCAHHLHIYLSIVLCEQCKHDLCRICHGRYIIASCDDCNMECCNVCLVQQNPDVCNACMSKR